MSFLRKSSVIFAFVGLAACSTPPQNPNGSDGSVAIDGMAATDSAPGLNGADYGSNDSQVQISGVNQDGIASMEIGGATDLNGQAMQEVNAEFEPVIYFDYDQFALSEQALQTIQYYAQVAMENPTKKMILEGHTDDRGTPEYNLALGEKRAKAVAQAMVALGVESDRIEANSFGEEYPVAFDKTEEAWSLNRRVEITIR